MAAHFARSVWLLALLGSSLGCTSSRPATRAPVFHESVGEQTTETERTGEQAPTEPETIEAATPAREPEPVEPAPLELLGAHEPLDADVRAAAADAENGKLVAAAKRLSGSIARIDRDATLEDRMLAHALLGRHQRLAGNVAAARKEYAKVLAAWQQPAAAMQSITSGKSDDSEALRRAGQALNAVGEALFADGEEKRAKALALRPPAFRGIPSQDAILRHLETPIRDWLEKRTGLEREAEQAYRRVVDIQPVPPPRWVIASAAQIGSMYEARIADLTQVPVPPTFRKDPELFKQYRDALDDAMAPTLDRARSVYRTCQEYGAKYRISDDYEKLCETRILVLESKQP